MTSNQQSLTSALWSFFQGKGFSAQQDVNAVAGVEGNIQTESDFSPTAYNSREGAQGLAQWEGGRGDSGALGAYARQTGGSVTSLTTQEGFLESELNGSYSRTVTDLRNASNPTQAALAWATDFEGNAPASDGQREANASSIYSQLRGQVASLAAGQPVTFPDTGASSSSSSSGDATATDTSVISSITGLPTMAEVGNIVIKSVVVMGGLGLIVVGLFRASGTEAPSAADAGKIAAAAA